MDIAGGIMAARVSARINATVAIEAMEFIAPNPVSRPDTVYARV